MPASTRSSWACRSADCPRRRVPAGSGGNAAKAPRRRSGGRRRAAARNSATPAGVTQAVMQALLAGHYRATTKRARADPSRPADSRTPRVVLSRKSKPPAESTRPARPPVITARVSRTNAATWRQQPSEPGDHQSVTMDSSWSAGHVAAMRGRVQRMPAGPSRRDGPFRTCARVPSSRLLLYFAAVLVIRTLEFCP